MKIALAGFYHEAHSFIPTRTSLERFREHYFAFGPEEMRKLAGTSTEMAGVFDIASSLGFDLQPIFYAFPLPGGPLTAEAFDFFRAKLVEVLRSLAPLDGVILNLHGAMIAENALDAEGEFLRAARETIGDEVPIAATLDCHGNVSELMARSADALIPYDTNPHVDCYERGVQAARLLREILDGKVKPVTALAKPPLLLAPQGVNSSLRPFRDVASLAAEWEQRPGVLNVGVLPGYCYSDVPEVGLSIVAITDNDPQLAREIGEAVARKAWELRHEFARKLSSPAEAVREAIQEQRGPVILVDTGDNVGGGSAADGTVLLHELLRQHARDAVMMIRDPEAVEHCFRIGVGAILTVPVGGKTDNLHGAPVPVSGRVRLLSDGRYINRGPMHGMNVAVEWQMGRCAVLECDSVTLLLTEHRVMPMNIHQLKSQGIQPEHAKIIVVKAAHSFRPSYEPIAARIIEVDTPGLTTADLSRFPYRNLTRRLFPLRPYASFVDTSVTVHKRSGVDRNKIESLDSGFQSQMSAHNSQRHPWWRSG